MMVVFISLAASLATTVLMVGATIMIFLNTSIRHMEEYAAYMAESLATAAIDPLLEEAYVSLEGAVETFRGRQDVSGAFVIDQSGSIVASLNRDQHGESAEAMFADAVQAEGWFDAHAATTPRHISLLTLISTDLLAWHWPVEYGGASLGDAVVVLSLTCIRRRLLDILGMGLATGIAAFAVAMVVGLPLAFRVSQPIEALAGLAVRIADGEETGDPPESRVAEVSALAESMLDMARKLEARRLAADRARESVVAAHAELKASSELLSRALNEKTVLLREVHHRVKNNLQVIVSLLELQLEEMRDPADAAALRQGQTRIRSMALAHEMLYKSDDLADIHMGSYLEALCADLTTCAKDGTAVSFECQIQNFSLSIDEAVPLGLVVNELVTNSIKHAFRGRGNGTVYLSLSVEPGTGTSGEAVADIVTLIVSDDGTGAPGGQAPDPALGLTLIKALADQLGATLTWNWSGGVSASLCFVRSRFFPRPENSGIMAS